MIFKIISLEEYDRLTPKERMNYLKRLQADIRDKMEQIRRQVQETNRRVTGSEPLV